MQLDGVRGEVSYEDGEQLVQHVLVQARQLRLLQDQLAVDDEREELADGEQEVQVAALLLVGGGGGDERAQRVRLLAEAGDVGQGRVRVEGGAPVVEAYGAEATGRALPEEEVVVGRVEAGRDGRVLRRVQQVVAHELQDQREVDVDRALELGQPADLDGGLGEVVVLLEALGGDDVPHQVDDLLALRGHLHLRHRVEEEVAAVFGARGAEVVDCAVAEQLHPDETDVRVGQLAAHVREGGDGAAVEDAVLRVGHGLVHRVLADADRGGAEVELADVDGVEGGVEGGPAGVQDVVRADRVVLEAELADVLGGVDDVLHQVVGRVAAVGGEEHVPVRALDVGATAEDGDESGGIAVADVVLGAGGPESAVAVGLQQHVGGVDVGAVRLLRQAEGEHLALGEEFGRAGAGGGVVALPDGAEAEDGHLPRVPVVEAVEPEDLVEGGDPGGVPALVGVAVGGGGRREERGEQAFLGGEGEEVRQPGAGPVVLDQPALAALLEPVDGGAQQPAGLGVEVLRVVGARVEQQGVGHGGPPSERSGRGVKGAVADAGGAVQLRGRGAASRWTVASTSSSQAIVIRSYAMPPRSTTCCSSWPASGSAGASGPVKSRSSPAR